MADVAGKVNDLYGDLLQNYRMTACCSFHTTAGYLEQRTCARLGYSEKRLAQFIGAFQKLFPPGAGYFHDRMEMREELDESQKEREPFNGDSHLAFIGVGLKNCVTYINSPKLPIYFIDLDGVYKNNRRNRRTTILAYNREEIVYRGKFFVPVSAQHAINSFNLKDNCYGLFSHLNDLLESQGIDKGIIEISLAPEERHAALTVNEYETLLMRNDLPNAMSNPLRYMLRRCRDLLQYPTSIPGKTRSYVIYDLIHLYNKLMKKIHMTNSVVDKVLPRLSLPLTHIFRFKKNIKLLVVGGMRAGSGRIVQGTYQSPILLQYRKADKGVRYLDITLRSLE
jgi:hypothetical protein